MGPCTRSRSTAARRRSSVRSRLAPALPASMIRSARRHARSDATRAPRSGIVEGLSASAASALTGFYQDTGLQQGLRPADKMRAPRGRVDWGLRDQPLPGSLGVLDAIGRGVYPRLAAI